MASSPPPRPHLLTRSRTSALADRAIDAIWRNGLHPRPALEPEALWDIGAKGCDPADEHYGRSAEDVADFRLRLEHLCQSLRDEAQLNALGHTMAYGQITAAIRMRHRLGALWRSNPGIEQTAIAPPIIVVGQMRAGTTRMHRLLAADPAHAGTPFYCAMNPVRKQPELRPIKTRIGIAVARQINPWIDMQHPFGATLVDEELPWLSYALSPAALEAQYRIPSFVAFSEARDPAPVYREFARVLRSDAAQMGNAARPRVLKCPQYAEDLPALLAQFPEARVVVTRRCSDEILASTLSVVAGQMAYQSDRVDLDALETEWRRKLALREARMTAALAGFSGPVAEVEFDALGADWKAEIARVYRTLGLPLSGEAMAAMRAEQGRAETSPHHGHRAVYQF
ncbi:sulfotransferase [Aurantiacibacter xanthus]|uniref:Sulfotransferase n=1 Tax=Aurantiacibacter xanthus TaxID=1784712 RepID=A0A3A1PBW5_9SPHN|nr:sulfotransferase [Aurantiacibacter xanthus]RIV90500.1 sulfotransferase [Aurantiacibacter xanthus]